jgi:RHS repeat-associated protein
MVLDACASYGDSTQLVYLRARYYAAADGRFQSKDTWEGDINSPITLNRWAYAHSNPINLTDPSGKDPWWCDYAGTQDEQRVCLDNWSKDRTNSAADYAISNYGLAKVPLKYGSDCTNFISQVLANSSHLSIDDVWKPGICTSDFCPWVNTPDFYNYVKSRGYTPSEEFINTEDFRDDREGITNNWLKLRENNDNVAVNNGVLPRMKWPDFINRHKDVSEDDLVFSKDENHSWSHVAIITGWGPETTYAISVKNNIYEPRLIDHDGWITDFQKLPRSIGDTGSPYITSVVFMYKPKR